MKKRILSLTICIAMILVNVPIFSISVFAVMPQLKEYNAYYDGAYHIEDVLDFTIFAGDVRSGYTFAGETVYLEADVEFTGPLGRWADNEAQKKCFRGTFDGKGHTLTQNYSDTLSDVGVFSATGTGAVIKNLTVKGTISGNYSVGGFVGNASGTTFENCVNESKVIAKNNFAGGIAGWSGNNTKFINCKNNGTVSSQGEEAGGIAGCLRASSAISDCENTGSVTAKKHAGGIVGRVFDGSKVSISINQGEVKSSAGFVGGIAGSVESGTIANVVNNGNVSYTETSSGAMLAGGILGTGHAGEVTHAMNKGEVSGTYYAGGIIGINYNGFSVSSCVNYGMVKNPSAGKNMGTGVGGIAAGTGSDQNGNISLCANYGDLYGYDLVSGIAGVPKAKIRSCVSFCKSTGAKRMGDVSGVATFTSDDGVFGNSINYDYIVRTLNSALTNADKEAGNFWSYDTKDRIVPILTNGFGTRKSPFSITTVDELLLFAQMIRGGWNNDYNPDNELYVRLDDDIYDDDAVMVPIGKPEMTDKAQVNEKYAFKGHFDGNGHTVHLKMKVTGADFGGLFGVTSGAVITNLRVAGSITAENQCGGIVGNATDTILFNCQNDANITGAEYVGGIVGRFQKNKSGAYIVNGLNRGIITATKNFAGGIAGGISGNLNAEAAVMERCLNIGKVIQKSDSGNADGVCCFAGDDTFALKSVYYCEELSGVKSKCENCSKEDLLSGTIPEGLSDQLSSDAKKQVGESTPYTFSVSGKSVAFKEFNLKAKEAAAHFPAVEPDLENDGHKEYWYSYYDNLYYEDEKCKRKIPTNTLDTWLKTAGKGLLEKLDEKTSFIIDEHYFREAEDAEEYLSVHAKDGIRNITLGGNITTTTPIRIVGDDTVLTVNMNGYNWTYSGGDDTAVFETTAKNVRLGIYGADLTTRSKKEADKNIYDMDTAAIPTITMGKNCRCRLLSCDGIRLTTDYVRVLGATSTTCGGAIYATSELIMETNFTVFENCSAWIDGGAVAIKFPENSENIGGSKHISHMWLNNTVFRNCSAARNGGGVWTNNEIEIDGENTSGFVSCHAESESGGAVASMMDYAFATCDIENLLFDKCYCGHEHNINYLKMNSNPQVKGGGAISMFRNATRVENCEFRYCVSDGCGGSIYADDAHMGAVRNSTFINSAAVKFGQDICIDNTRETFILTFWLEDVVLDNQDGTAGLLVHGKDERARIAVIGYKDIDIQEKNILRKSSSIYGSILSGGSPVAVIVVSALALLVTAALILYLKRKKKADLKET